MASWRIGVRVGIALLFGGTLAFDASFAADHESVSEKLMQLERTWCNASIKNDIATLDKTMADDLIDVSPDGRVTTKAQELASTHADPNASCELDLMQVHVYDDAAVVVGRLQRKSGTYDGQVRFADTFVRRSGRWQYVATTAATIK
jgi:ketosteroid isomerase-like protein